MNWEPRGQVPVVFPSTGWGSADRLHPVAQISLSRRLQWRGRTVAWDRFGQGPPLVFLHGATFMQAEESRHLTGLPLGLMKMNIPVGRKAAGQRQPGDATSDDVNSGHIENVQHLLFMYNGCCATMGACLRVVRKFLMPLSVS